jgi:hypothetical protein
LVSGTRGREFESRIAHHQYQSSSQRCIGMPRGKGLLLIVVLGAALYFLMSYHIILTNRGTRLLKKSSMTLQYTLFSTKGKANKSILAIDALRKAGIGDLLKREGLMTEEEELRILETLDVN